MCSSCTEAQAILRIWRESCWTSMKSLGAEAKEMHRKAWFAQAGEKKKRHGGISLQFSTTGCYYEGRANSCEDWPVNGKRSILKNHNKEMSDCIEAKKPTNQTKKIPPPQKNTIVGKHYNRYPVGGKSPPSKFWKSSGQSLEQQNLTLKVRSFSCFEQEVVL